MERLTSGFQAGIAVVIFLLSYKSVEPQPAGAGGSPEQRDLPRSTARTPDTSRGIASRGIQSAEIPPRQELLNDKLYFSLTYYGTYNARI